MFDYLWKEHRRLVYAMLGFLLLLLLWNWFVLSSIRGDSARLEQDLTTMRNNYTVQVAQGVPTESILQAARKDRDDMKKLLGDLKGDLEIKIPDSIKVGGQGSDAVTAFQFKFDEMEKGAQRQAQQTARGFVLPQKYSQKVPEFRNEVTPERASDFLTRAALGFKLLGWCIDSGLDKVTGLEIFASTDPRSLPEINRSALMDAYLISFQGSGKTEGVFKLLHRLQQRGDFVSVETLRIMKKDPTVDLVEVDLLCGGLVLNTDQPPVAKEKEDDQNKENPQ